MLQNAVVYFSRSMRVTPLLRKLHCTSSKINLKCWLLRIYSMELGYLKDCWGLSLIMSIHPFGLTEITPFGGGQEENIFCCGGLSGFLDYYASYSFKIIIAVQSHRILFTEIRLVLAILISRP